MGKLHTRRIARHGGSLVLNIPPSLCGEAGIVLGDLVSTWTPMEGVIVAEKIVLMGGNTHEAAARSRVFLAADHVIEKFRAQGEGFVDMDERPCTLCEKTSIGITYNNLRLCRACEGAVALGRAAQLIGIFEGKIRNGD